VGVNRYLCGCVRMCVMFVKDVDNSIDSYPDSKFVYTPIPYILRYILILS
jgi:hypothetical protein